MVKRKLDTKRLLKLLGIIGIIAVVILCGHFVGIQVLNYFGAYNVGVCGTTCIGTVTVILVGLGLGWVVTLIVLVVTRLIDWLFPKKEE